MSLLMKDGGICCERAENSLQVTARSRLHVVVVRGGCVVAVVVVGGVVVVEVVALFGVVGLEDGISGKSIIRSLTW